jgi:hypothetical protein
MWESYNCGKFVHVSHMEILYLSPCVFDSFQCIRFDRVMYVCYPLQEIMNLKKDVMQEIMNLKKIVMKLEVDGVKQHSVKTEANRVSLAGLEVKPRVSGEDYWEVIN